MAGIPIEKDKKMVDLKRLLYAAADLLTESVDGHKEYDYDTRAKLLAEQILIALQKKGGE